MKNRTNTITFELDPKTEFERIQEGAVIPSLVSFTFPTWESAALWIWNSDEFTLNCNKYSTVDWTCGFGSGENILRLSIFHDDFVGENRRDFIQNVVNSFKEKASSIIHSKESKDADAEFAEYLKSWTI